MQKLLTTIFILFLPKIIKPFFLRLLGHKVHNTARIAFSVVSVKKLDMGEGASIGRFNYIKMNHLSMDKKAIIGDWNKISGDFDIIMDEVGLIRNRNSLSRAYFPVTYGQAVLSIGKYAAITHGHQLDLTRSIVLGDYTTLAGSSTQLWTHGYFHAETGVGRIRVDGEIIIGNNVYVGASCVFNAGVKIANGITVGSNCCISKSLSEKGMYVSQPLRFIESDIEKVKAKLTRVNVDGLEDIVYEKTIN